MNQFRKMTDEEYQKHLNKIELIKQQKKDLYQQYLKDVRKLTAKQEKIEESISREKDIINKRGVYTKLRDAEMYKAFKGGKYTFEDLAKIYDLSVQRIAREIERQDKQIIWHLKHRISILENREDERLYYEEQRKKEL